MKIIEEDRELLISGSGRSVRNYIAEENAGFLMGILSNSLSSNTELAVLREYATNAWDAHAEAGILGTPIRVRLPLSTLDDDAVTIRDFGAGLSEDEIFEIFPSMGHSTKRASNTSAGMFGIGSKAGFAYGDSFTITSFHGGRKLTFLYVLDTEGIGTLNKLDDVPWDPEDTGIEIKVPVLPEDVDSFQAEAANFFRYWDPRPDINVTIDVAPHRWIGDVGLLHIKQDRSYVGHKPYGWTALVGCVPYRIDTNMIRKESEEMGFADLLRQQVGVLVIPLEENDKPEDSEEKFGIKIAASREALEYTAGTKATLAKYFAAFAAELVQEFEREAEEARSFAELRKLVRLYGLGFGVRMPSDFEPLLKAEMHLYNPNERVRDSLTKEFVYAEDGAPLFTRPDWALHRVEGRHQGRRAWGRFAEGVIRAWPYTDEAIIILMDERKNLRRVRYAGQLLSKITTYVVESRTGAPLVEEALDRADTQVRNLLEANYIDHIPVIRLSALEYEKPTYQRSTAKYKQSIKLFQVRADQEGLVSPGSDCWEPFEGELNDESVWITIHRFRPVARFQLRSGGSIYDQDIFKTLHRFRSGLAALGFSKENCPKIVGVKASKAKPINYDVLPGLELPFWAILQFLELFGADNEDTQLFYASRLLRTMRSNGDLPIDHRLSDMLDFDHPIRKFVRDIQDARRLYRSKTHSRISAVAEAQELSDFVSQYCAGHEGAWPADAKTSHLYDEGHRGDLRLAEIYGRYPLLNPQNFGPGLRAFTQDETAQIWAEYVNNEDQKKEQK